MGMPTPEAHGQRLLWCVAQHAQGTEGHGDETRTGLGRGFARVAWEKPGNFRGSASNHYAPTLCQAPIQNTGKIHPRGVMLKTYSSDDANLQMTLSATSE